jgi:multidrug resistance efflux pump
MSESILEQSRRSRVHGFFGFFKRKPVIAVIVLLVVGGGGWYYYQSRQAMPATTAVKQKEVRAEKGDIRIAIEADGKVVAEDGVDLSFSVSADTLEVTGVYVKVGDAIKKGDKIATVAADSLEMSVRTAYASYQSVLASYNEKLLGATELEITKAENSIKQAEIAVKQAEENLAKVRTNAEKSVEDAQDAIDTAKDNMDQDFKSDYQKTIDKSYKDLLSSMKSTVISLESLLKDSDEILGVDDKFINDSFEDSLGVKDVTTYSAAVSTYNKSKKAYEVLNSKLLTMSDASSQASIRVAADEAADCLKYFEDHLYAMQLMLSSTITSATFSQNSLDAMKSSVSSARSNINSKISSLDASVKSVGDAEDALADYQSDFSDNAADFKKVYDKAVKNLATVKMDNAQDIKDAERSIETKKLSLAEAKDNLAELKEPLSAAEIASAKSQLTSAAVSLERAQGDLENATLVAPIDGEVSAMNYKVGDTILKDDTDPVASIINKATMFVEVNIEEADINKLSVGQKADAIFDALDGKKMQGEVSFISMTSETSNSGIVTYLVRVLFENQKDSGVREGMTASIEFTTAGVSDVVYVPVDAVRNVGGKPSVQLQSGEWAVVTTGFTDGENVEIMAGIEEGVRVVY